MDVEKTDTSLKAEAVHFLARDFEQCFAQMRHYDSQLVEIYKFTFAAYTTTLGGALALYKYGLEKGIDYLLPSAAIAGVGLLVGLCTTAFAVRSRVYFVAVARYVNEHRKFFLDVAPLGFENRSRMHTNAEQPVYWNWRSSHSLLLVINAGLNSVVLITMWYFLANGRPRWSVALGASVLAWLVQLAAAVVYLVSREHKGVPHATFGKRRH